MHTCMHIQQTHTPIQCTSIRTQGINIYLILTDFTDRSVITVSVKTTFPYIHKCKRQREVLQDKGFLHKESSKSSEHNFVQIFTALIYMQYAEDCITVIVIIV